MPPARSALLALLLAAAALAAEPSPWQPSRASARSARELPSSAQLAEIRRVVELVRESRDQLPPEKLSQLAQQLRQLRARIDSSRELDRGSKLVTEEEESGSTEAASSSVHQVRSLSGGWNNNLDAHTLDPAKDTLFYDDIHSGSIEAPPANNGGSDGYHDNSENDGYYGDSGVSINVGVSGSIQGFSNGKSKYQGQIEYERPDEGKRVFGVGSSIAVPHDVRSYGTPKPGGGGGGSPLRIHPAISQPLSPSLYFNSVHNSLEGGSVGGGLVGFGPPKSAVSAGDAFAGSATTTRSFLDHSHLAQGQLFHEDYVQSGYQSAVIPPSGPRATVHIAPAVGPHAGTVVIPASPPHVEPVVAPAHVAARAPAAVSVHIGIGHQPVVEYNPPATVTHEEHVLVEPPRAGSGKIIFPVSGPHHAEASYVAPPPDVHVTHVEEHVTSNHLAPVHVSYSEEHHEPHVTHVEENVYEEYHKPHSSHVEEYHEPLSSYVEEHYEPSHGTPHDASQYGPPHKDAQPILVPYTPQYSSHPRPVYIPQKHKRQPGILQTLLRPLWGLKNLLFGGGRGHARPEAYAPVETPAHNYYEYGSAVHKPKKCRCIGGESVLGLVVAGVAAAGLAAYAFSLNNGTAGLGRTVDGPDRAAMARLMLQEACSLGADTERMWNGTVWLGEDNEDEWEDDRAETGKDKQALERGWNSLGESDKLSHKRQNSVEESREELGWQEQQLTFSRSARQLGTSGTTTHSGHQVVKKLAAGPATTTSSSLAEVERKAKTKRSVLPPDAAEDTIASASSNLHMFSFDGMDIPMRRSAYDPGLPVPALPRKATFQPPPPLLFTPDSRLLSRRIDLADDAPDTDLADRDDPDALLTLEEGAPAPGVIPASILSNDSFGTAVKATRDLASGGGDLLSVAVSLLPMIDLGPFQPLTRAFEAVPVEERGSSASEKGPRQTYQYRKRMKSMFAGLRRFVTKGVPSLMKRTAYDPHCGCIPLTLENVGLVGAPIFAVVASALVLAFLIMQSYNQGNGRKRSDDPAATEELASVLETILTEEQTAADNSTEPARLRSYYRQIITPAARRSPQLAALSGALGATSVECSRYYMCQMAMTATSFGEPFDIGIPLLSLPVSWMLTETQGGEFGQYCSSAVVGGSGSGNCALLYPSCNES